MTSRTSPVESDTGRSRLAGIGWWVATIITMVILDDLLFGPLFWVLATVTNPKTAAVIAGGTYWLGQSVVVWWAVLPYPPRWAAWWVERLQINYARPEIQRRANTATETVAGGATAMAMSLLIGGVIPPLMLARRGWPIRAVRNLAPFTAAVYATEFALLHGYGGGSALDAILSKV